jgi:hypothetical protein
MTRRQAFRTCHLLGERSERWTHDERTAKARWALLLCIAHDAVSSKEKERARGSAVSRLKNLLHASGETRAVDEREISDKQVIKDFRSVDELHGLFARKPRSVLWLCESAYLYKRSRLISSLDLLDVNVAFRGLYVEIQDETSMYDIEVHWDDTKRSNCAMIASIDRFFRLMARDGAVRAITISYQGPVPIPFLPVSPPTLGRFFRYAAGPRTVYFNRIRLTCPQAPMLFKNLEGSVVLKGLDVSLLHDGGTSLLRAVRRNSPGIRHLCLENQMSESFFNSLMYRLSKNHTVNTLSIVERDLSDPFVQKLTQALRFNTSICNFKCEECSFSIDGWSMLWRAIKGNTTITSMSICGTRSGSRNSWSWRHDDAIRDAIQANTSLVDFEINSSDHHRTFLSQIAPFLRRNRIRKFEREVSTEQCQSKRWRLLGRALKLPKIRNRRSTVYALIRSNVDTWVAHAPTGKQTVLQQISALDKQRAILLANLREYEDPRKRKRDEDDAVGGGNRRLPLRNLQDSGEREGRSMRRRGAPRL